MLTVVAAIIVRRGRLLICQRRAADSFPLKWEFPGGKVRPGESLAAALERELIEELGVRATIGREACRTRHRYPELDDDLELVFLWAEIADGPVENRAFERMEWAAPHDLARYDFLPADRDLVRILAKGGWERFAPRETGQLNLEE